MAAKSIQSLLEDIRLVSELNFQIVEAVRAVLRAQCQPLSEELKYGGILFSAGLQFCGVFAYKAHVSVEFGHGALIQDPWGHLEGEGKGRRHIKLRSLDDLQSKALADYLPLALAAAKQAQAA